MDNLNIKSENKHNERLHAGTVQVPKRDRWNNRRRYSFLTQHKFI